MCRPKGCGFCTVLSENGYKFSHFGLELGMIFERTTEVYERYLLVQFQMSKNELEIFEFEMHLKKLVVLRSNLRNVNIISA